MSQFPFWYVCENNFQYFVGCRDAYEGVYGDKDLLRLSHPERVF